ncbi:MAG: hypothetical protein ACMXYC_04915 [Candidatus Woesearchaeota archaeon]
MATITLNISDETKKRMKQFDEVNWSAFVRNQIEKKTKDILKMHELKKKLEKEKDFTTFAVKLQRAGRSGRLEELKKKGLL